MKTLLQYCSDPRFTETWFAGDQHHLAFSRLGARPAAQQKADFLVAADQWTERRTAQCLETARDNARTQHLPSGHRVGDALDLDRAEIAIVEQIADQTARARGDDDSVRLGQSLQTGSEVGCLAHDQLFLRRALADQIANDHEPGGDADARLQRDGTDIEAADRIDNAQPRPDSMLCIILMRARVAEIDHDAVAHILGDKAFEPYNDFSDGAVIGGDNLAQILGVKACGELGRADQVAEHHRQLPALGNRRRGPWLAAQRGDCFEQFAAVAPQHHAEILQILRRELGQGLLVDLMIAECDLVSIEAEAPQPDSYVHQAPLSSSSSTFASLKSGVSKPSVNQP